MPDATPSSSKRPSTPLGTGVLLLALPVGILVLVALMMHYLGVVPD